MASLRDIKIEGKLTPEALDISQCLRADEWIDHDHPDMIMNILPIIRMALFENDYHLIDQGIHFE